MYENFAFAHPWKFIRWKIWLMCFSWKIWNEGNLRNFPKHTTHSFILIIKLFWSLCLSPPHFSRIYHHVCRKMATFFGFALDEKKGGKRDFSYFYPFHIDCCCIHVWHFRCELFFPLLVVTLSQTLNHMYPTAEGKKPKRYFYWDIVGTDL